MKLMKKLLPSLLIANFGLIAAFGLQASAALKEGEVAPDFKIQASFAGKASNFSLKDQLKKSAVVVYFYPSAYTRGCNIQAHDFSATSEQFTAAGAKIIGVSLDSIDRLNEFSADPDYCAGKISVGSDADGKVAQAYGLEVRAAQEGKLDTRGKTIDHGFAERTTFVITQDGKINSVIGGLTPAENVQKTLDIVTGLHLKKAQ